MIKKIRENKKGFTLVELIVVLVILAILAALLIPALTGYIDKAKEKQIIAETRQVVMAAQTLADEEYAKQNVGADDIAIGNPETFTKQAIADLAEVKADNISSVTVTSGKVTSVKYTLRGKMCTYSGTTGEYTVGDASASE